LRYPPIDHIHVYSCSLCQGTCDGMYSHDHTGWSHGRTSLDRKCPIISKTTEIRSPKSQVCISLWVPRQWPPLHVIWNCL
jgi:hypothetical protein